MQQKLFSKADTDFNGLISFQELNVAEFQRLKQFSGMQFKRLDTNSNNFLSEDEIIADHFNDQANFADNMQGSKASLLKTYDLDRNGSITTDEIDIALERREVKLKRDAKKEGRKTFKKIDKDGNGFISKDEHEHNSTFFLEALMGNSPAGKSYFKFSIKIKMKSYQPLNKKPKFTKHFNHSTLRAFSQIWKI